jgi:hypothetical protein
MEEASRGDKRVPILFTLRVDFISTQQHAPQRIVVDGQDPHTPSVPTTSRAAH